MEDTPRAGHLVRLQHTSVVVDRPQDPVVSFHVQDWRNLVLGVSAIGAVVRIAGTGAALAAVTAVLVLVEGVEKDLHAKLGD